MSLAKADLELLKKDAPPPECVLVMFKDGLDVVKTRNPRDAASYSSMVTKVAQQTAGATKEGGFLGIGGTQITKEEQAALDAVHAVLN